MVAKKVFQSYISEDSTRTWQLKSRHVGSHAGSSVPPWGRRTPLWIVDLSAARIFWIELALDPRSPVATGEGADFSVTVSSSEAPHILI